MASVGPVELSLAKAYLYACEHPDIGENHRAIISRSLPYSVSENLISDLIKVKLNDLLAVCADRRLEERHFQGSRC